jgi:ornithine decarboxylase
MNHATIDPMARARHVAAALAARSSGRTPLLLLDLDRVARQIALWRQHLPQVAPFYAIKANSAPQLLDHLAALGVDFDAATGGELDVVAAHAGPPRRVVCTHPVRDDADLQAIVRHRPAYVVVQQQADIEHLVAAGVPGPDYAPTLLVRIALPFSNLDKFGLRVLSPIADGEAATWQIDAAAVVDLFAKATSSAAQHGRRFAGFGLAGHVGTNCAIVDHYRMLVALFRLLREHAEGHGFALDTFDIGGGYCDDEAAATAGTTTAALLHEIGGVVAAAAAACPAVQWIAEPGRFLVADAAVLLTTVKSVQQPAWRFQPDAGWLAEPHLEVHIDDGIYGNLMGQEHDSKRWRWSPREARPATAPLLPARIWGATCDTYDCIADLPMLPADLRRGDVLMVPGAGAYTLATNTRFNRTAPTRVFAYRGDAVRGVRGRWLDGAEEVA